MQWLQEAAGVTADGVIGAVTLTTLAAADPDKIIMRFDAARLKYLAALGTWPSFGRGWVIRIANNLVRATQ